MPNHERAQKITTILTDCLAELDNIEATVAAAHLDSALNALRLQFDLSTNAPKTDYHRKDVA